MSQDPLYLDINSFASLADLFRVAEEPECSKVQFAENVNLRKYIEKSYRGNILSYNNWTKHMLRLEEIKLRLPSLANAGDVVELVQRLNSASSLDEEQSYSAGIVIQLVTRLLTFSLQFRRSLSAVPKDRLTSALSAVSDYHSAVLDHSTLSQRYRGKYLRTISWKKLKYVTIAFQSVQRSDGIISGASPFVVTGGAIQPLDTTVLKNLIFYEVVSGKAAYIQSALHLFMRAVGRYVLLEIYKHVDLAHGIGLLKTEVTAAIFKSLC
ncbi:6774_t:CDS:2 [Funneliformis caledonium]|uniref:6774_t:CDS:1 n=1 Tax=Funneliformis caledonium TaxID=1117310 RepID=A0A9N9ACE6_9GLOM|nr:6774_t:CDS:2 [Funneliformis caledonium]